MPFIYFRLQTKGFQSNQRRGRTSNPCAGSTSKLNKSDTIDARPSVPLVLLVLLVFLARYRAGGSR